MKLGDLPRKGQEDGYKSVKLTPSQVLTVGIYNAMPADLSHAVKKNYLSAFRGCVEANRAFSLNPSRDKVKTAKPAGNTKTAKPADTKAGAVKQSLADVIKANFKTLLANNPQAAAELLDTLAELLDA